MRDECHKWNECNAPICPLSPDEENENYTWFPDEDICTKNSSPQWVRNQRKIAKKAKDNQTYFTFEMLKRKCVIKEGITGLNPDVAEELQLKKWIKSHPVKKRLSEEQKQILRDRFAKVR